VLDVGQILVGPMMIKLEIEEQVQVLVTEQIIIVGRERKH
jgi:hypothetical protein